MKTRKQMLALIALADAPMPQDIYFGADKDGTQYILMRLDSGGDLQAWVALVDNGHSGEGRLYSSGLYFDGGGDWHGWSITFNATEQPEQPLDDETRAALAAVSS